MNTIVKTAEDYILASLILLLLIPLLIILAIIIKIDSPGPVIYKQKRHGLFGKKIVIYKFRTMFVNNESKVLHTKRNDPRLTFIGAFLRKTSLDELPQFINVLQGRMSIVGPRPHACEHNDYYTNKFDQYMKRHNVKPGITGWAQINGYRGGIDVIEEMENRLKYDFFYINNWSLLFDIKIIFKTIFFIVCIHDKAY